MPGVFRVEERLGKGLSLIDVLSLAAYERYREALAADPEHVDLARRAAQSGVILIEDRSFVQRA